MPHRPYTDRSAAPPLRQKSTRLCEHLRGEQFQIHMSHGQDQLFMLRMFLIVIGFGGDLIGFQFFVQPDAFGIRIYIVDA